MAMDMEPIAQKKSLISSRFSATTLVGALILAIALFVLLAQNAKTYRSTVTIMIIAKSPAAAQQKDAIADNIAALPRTLSFYDRLLADNPTISDPTAGSAPDKRKALWDGFMQVQQPNASDKSIIELSTLAKSPSDSQILSTDAARTLFSVASGYYDVKNDIDLRIIDGPITSAEVDGWQWLALWSMLIGVAAAYLIGELFSPGPRAATDSQKSFGNIFVTPKIKPIASLEDIYLSQDRQETFDIPDTQQHEQPAIAEEIPTEPAIEVPKWEYPNFPEMPARNASHIEAGGPVSHGLQSSAPANLPIADEPSFSPLPPVDTQASSGENTTATMPQAEPTPEQLKARLNQLSSKPAHEPTQDEIKNRLNQLLKGEL